MWARAPFLATLLLVALLAPAPAAGARAGGGPPRAVLHIGDRSQRGRLVEEVWTRREGAYCVAQQALGTGQVPRALAVEPGGHRARLRLSRRQRPKRVVLSSFTEADSDRLPVGPATDVPFDLLARRRAGRVRAWIVRFRATVEDHLYLDLYARWRDHSGCDGERWIERRYHLRASSP